MRPYSSRMTRKRKGRPAPDEDDDDEEDDDVKGPANEDDDIDISMTAEGSNPSAADVGSMTYAFRWRSDW